MTKLTQDIMDRYTADELRDMARRYAAFLDGSMVRSDGRPMPHRFHQAWELVRSGQV